MPLPFAAWYISHPLFVHAPLFENPISALVYVLTVDQYFLVELLLVNAIDVEALTLANFATIFNSVDEKFPVRKTCTLVQWF